jgi:hypothetical protein
MGAPAASRLRLGNRPGFVPQPQLHFVQIHVQIHARLNETHRERVPKVMEMNIRDFGFR